MSSKSGNLENFKLENYLGKSIAVEFVCGDYRKKTVGVLQHVAPNFIWLASNADTCPVIKTTVFSRNNPPLFEASKEVIIRKSDVTAVELEPYEDNQTDIDSNTVKNNDENTIEKTVEKTPENIIEKTHEAVKEELEKNMAFMPNTILQMKKAEEANALKSGIENSHEELAEINFLMTEHGEIFFKPLPLNSLEIVDIDETEPESMEDYYDCEK